MVSSKAIYLPASTVCLMTLLLETLAEHIHDGRFLRLIRELLKAGYLEDWKWNRTLSGARASLNHWANLIEYLFEQARRICRTTTHSCPHQRRAPTSQSYVFTYRLCYSTKTETGKN